MSKAINNISKYDAWILAARPRTLLAAFVPVIVGSSLAAFDNYFQPLAAVTALICAVLIQTGTNFVNDLYDFLTGKDTKDRLGPSRAVASGIITPKEMRLGIIIIFSITFLLGLYLVYLGGWPILVIGLISIGAGFAYTAGPFPLAYNGLGDIFVFLFFGFVGTVGTYYVQTLHLAPIAFWASIPVGALITNILVINNYRDRDEDRQNGKNTLAVIFGENFARLQYVAFMIVSYAVLVLVYFTFKKSLFVFLPMISFPIAFKLVKMIYTLKGTDLNKTLELTAKLSAIYGVLFALGILL